jgi:predicted NBD/HSP70 family sugar kinase
MREINSDAVLELLRKTDRMHVSELAVTTGLSRQAVARSLVRLQEAGLVEFLAPERSGTRTGRPSQPVRFRSEAGYAAGIYIDPRRIRAALADLRGDIVKSTEATLPQGASGHATVRQLVEHVSALLAEAGVAVEDVHAAAVGAPGIVDPSAGVIRLVPSMEDLTGDVVVRALSERLQCQVYLDNDVKLAAQGEQSHGIRRDDSSLVVVHWGQRIGAGILIDGVLYRGATNDAGDLGFLDFEMEGAVDSTPGLGRFEAWAGCDELVRLARSELERAGQIDQSQRLEKADDALEQVIAAILNGDTACLRALRDIAARFAVGLGAIRALLDPHVVVLSGPMARLGDVLLAELRHALHSHLLKLPKLKISALGDDAVIHGAIRHCLNAFERSRYAPIYQKTA